MSKDNSNKNSLKKKGGLINKDSMKDIMINEDIKLIQAELFKTFLAPNKEAEKKLSNTFNVWDKLGLFYRTTKQQNALKKSGFNEPIVDIKKIDGKFYETTVKPAQIIEKDKSELQLYYISENEEFVIKALMRIWSKQNGFILNKKNPTMYVIFKMQHVVDELKLINKSRSFPKIYKSIEICHNTNVACKSISERETVNSSTIFPTWENANVTGEKYHRISFCPAIMDALMNLEYRQYNYIEVFSNNCRLKRWLLMRLITCNNGIKKGGLKAHEISYSSIVNESLIFPNKDNWRNNMKYIRKTINDLASSGWIYSQDELNIIDNDYREIQMLNGLNIPKKNRKLEKIKFDIDGRTRIDCSFSFYPKQKLIDEIIDANTNHRNITNVLL